MWTWKSRVTLFRILLMILVISNGLPLGFSISNFNASIRDYDQQDGNNSTLVRTLQKEGPRYDGFVPAQYAVQYKEASDNALSGSSHSRGLIRHEHGGYGLNDYEYGGSGPFNHGGYNQHDFGHYDHGYEQGHGHLGHHAGFGYGGHHHKHYDHGLSAKFLLPVAGLALLGAAAALVSNPVLLQLGVISGRRRRDTSELTTGLDDFEILKHWPKSGEDNIIRRLKKHGKEGRVVNGIRTQIEDGDQRLKFDVQEKDKGLQKRNGYFKDSMRQLKGLQGKTVWLKRHPLARSSIEDRQEVGLIPVALKLKKIES